MLFRSTDGHIKVGNTTHDIGLPTQYEEVNVVCRAATGYENEMGRTTPPPYVYVKMFNPVTLDEQEVQYSLSNGYTQIKIPYGYIYQIWTKKSGLGASFRLSYTACTPQRWVHLWCLPTGVWDFGFNAICADDGESYRVAPFISQDYSVEPSECEWDMYEGDGYDFNGNYDLSDDYIEESTYFGILVSTTEVSFLVCVNSKSDTTLYWSKQAYGKSIPGLEEFYETNDHDWDAAQDAASFDYDGPLNTEKILHSLIDCPAALFACETPNYMYQRYLPGAGELKQLYNNKSSFNNIQADFDSVPAVDNAFHWSSSAYSTIDSWRVYMRNGGVDFNSRTTTAEVWALSAFTYNY